MAAEANYAMNHRKGIDYRGEEAMNKDTSTINEKTKQRLKEFEEECYRIPPDHECLEEYIKSGIDINSEYGDPEWGECSILANVIKGYGDFEKDESVEYGSYLYDVVSFFIDNGFDVEKYGSECLKNLCWSTYDRWILPIAEMFIDNGSKLDNSIEEEGGILDAIDSILLLEDSEFNNIMSAYYQMVEAAIEGEDYHGIRAFESCKGRVVTKVEKVVPDDEGKADKVAGSKYFHDGLILWCGEMPLFFSVGCQIYVNPIAAKSKTMDVSNDFKEIIGAHIDSISIVGWNTALLRFKENIGKVLFRYIFQGSWEKSFGYIEYISEDKENELPPPVPAKLFFNYGKFYSKKVRMYNEEIVIIKTEQGTYLSFAEKLSDEDSILKIIRVSDEICTGKVRKAVLPDEATVERLVYEDGLLRGVSICSSSKRIYITTLDGGFFGERQEVFVTDIETDLFSIDDIKTADYLPMAFVECRGDEYYSD